MREFHNTARTGKTRVWRVAVDGDQVITEYGELGGKMQRTVDTAQAKNKGRSNFVSAEEAAVQQMERTILLKRRKGYRELGEAERDNEIDFDNLPQNLCFYKPANTLSKRMLKEIESDNLWFTRKRDGEMMVVVKNSRGQVDIYSRRMLRSHHLEPDGAWADRFRHITEPLEASNIPPNTILLGEMVAGPQEDDRAYVASCMKSLTDESIAIQNHAGRLYFYCWDVAFWDGEDLVSTTCMAKRDLKIQGLYYAGNKYIVPLEVRHRHFFRQELEYLAGRTLPNTSLDRFVEEGLASPTVHGMAIAMAKVLEYEGWVVVDQSEVYGEKAYNFRGKPDRPGQFCGKLKPEFEDDFVALWNPDADQTVLKQGTWGRGKRQGQVGSVSLYQYDEDGELIYICDCGGGLIKTDAFAEKYSSPEDFPMVLQVKYTSRTYTTDGDKTNALQFPRVLAIREDKDIEECINDRL